MLENLGVLLLMLGNEPVPLAGSKAANFRFLWWRNKIPEFDPKKMKFEDLQPGDRR